MASPIYQFGEFQLDAEGFVLLRKGHSLRLERKPLELLILLVKGQSRLVTRAEIAECLWSKDVFVDTEHGINTAVRKIRAALRDDPETPRFVQTVTGMGYRFIAPTDIITEQASGNPLPSVQEPPTAAQIYVSPHAAIAEPKVPRRLWVTLAIVANVLCLASALAVNHDSLRRFVTRANVQPPIRSLAVLPLANYSGDPNQDYFADGMTDELITMLRQRFHAPHPVAYLSHAL